MNLVLVLGGGEFASATAVYLRQARIPVGIVVHPDEVHLRRPVCFSDAQYSGSKTIDEITARLLEPEKLVDDPQAPLSDKFAAAVNFTIGNREIPLWSADNFIDYLEILQPAALIKTVPAFFSDIDINSAKLVVGMAPFHSTGDECHLCIETRLNFRLGAVVERQTREMPDFDPRLFRKPFARVLSPIEGVFDAYKSIGDTIQQNEPFGTVNGIEIRSAYQGQIWGLFHSGRIIGIKSPLAEVFLGKGRTEYLDFGFVHRTVAGSLLATIQKFTS